MRPAELVARLTESIRSEQPWLRMEFPQWFARVLVAAGASEGPSPDAMSVSFDESIDEQGQPSPTDRAQFPLVGDLRPGCYVLFGAASSGKSNMVKLLAQQYASSGKPVIILDPMGDITAAKPGSVSAAAGDQIAELAKAGQARISVFALQPPPGAPRGESHSNLPVDIGQWLQPTAGEPATITILTFTRLPDAQEQVEFVRQFNMALYAWLSRAGAATEEVKALFVIDEAQRFAPSEPNLPSTASTLALARESRKYGATILFISQAPGGLHPGIVANSHKVAFGLLNSPAQIAAANQLARERTGSDLPELAKLGPGQFYVADLDTGVLSKEDLCQTPSQEKVLGLASGAFPNPK